MNFKSFYNITENVKGLDTSWQDGNVKVNIKQILQFLDYTNVPVKNIPVENLKPIIINQDYEGIAKERVQNANLQYPIIVSVSKGKYKSILDGNHRVYKTIINKLPTIKVRELNLDSNNIPKEFKIMFE